MKQEKAQKTAEPEDVLKIPFENTARKNLFDLGLNKEEIEKDLELMSSKLEEVLENPNQGKTTPDDSLELSDIKKKKIAYLEAELERQKKLLEFEKSKNSSEEIKKVVENHIKLTEETLANLKNTEKVAADPAEPEVVAPEAPTPETVPVATTEDREKESLAELKRTLRETIENAKKELAEIQRELREIEARELARKATEGLEKKERIAEELAARTETFPGSFIENIIASLLEQPKAKEKIKEVIEKPKIVGKGAEMILTTMLKIKTSPFTPSAEVKFKAVIGNVGNVLSIKNLEVQALLDMVKNEVEKTMSPYLGQISQRSKEFIEKEDKKNRKVEKIWIEDGQLKVLFA
jgi:hypothetical protein